MPANVETMFSVRQMPWHREGQVLETYPENWAQARILAGLDWDPEESPVLKELIPDAGLLARIEGIMTAGGTGQDILNAVNQARPKIDGYKQIIRNDTGATLGIRQDTYAIIDHGEMGEIVEAVLAQPNVKWETAGVLNDGKQVWCLVLLDEPIELAGDHTVTMPYLAITNAHDGSGSCALRATAVRIVCANTYRAAELEGERTGATFAFVHRNGWRDRIGEARQAVTGARDEIAAYKELSARLLGIPMSEAQVKLWLSEFVPAPPEGMVTDRVMANNEATRKAIRDILAGPTVEGAGIGGTAYGVVQAAGEYLDHARTARSWETRLNRTLLRPEPLKAKAASLALEVANAS